MQAKTLCIVALVSISVLAASAGSAQTCVVPPGFVDTPHPQIAPVEELISHTEEVVIERPLAVVRDLAARTPFRINRSGDLPGVTGAQRLNQGPFQAGARRLVCLTDGTASEEVLVWEQNPGRTRHRYVVWNYTSPIYVPVSYAVGEFVHTAISDTRTHVRWTYAFKLKPEADPGSFREKFLDRLWAPYMQNSLAGKKQRAEGLPPSG